MFAEVVAHGDSGFGCPIASPLVREIRHVVQVELGADEKPLLDRYLESRCKVDLEMIGTAERCGLRVAYGRTNAATLRDGETGARAADSSLQSNDRALTDQGLINAVHIDKRLP